jgi:hypothetical protein
VLFGCLEKRLVVALFAAACIPGMALAQTADIPAQTVSWTVQSQDVAKPGHAILTVHGSVVPGWHVYSLKQAPDGPTPLLVSVQENAVAIADGAPAGSAPVKFQEPAFNLQTQFYSSAFTLNVPVRFKPHVTGPQAIPLDVRFQTCNGRICEPPKTVHLSAPVTLPAEK